MPSGTHFNSGVTQLQTFPNSFGCCHPALLGTPPLPSEAPPLVFAFTSCSSAGTIVHRCCSPMYNYKDEAILRKTNYSQENKICFPSRPNPNPQWKRKQQKKTHLFPVAACSTRGSGSVIPAGAQCWPRRGGGLVLCPPGEHRSTGPALP